MNLDFLNNVELDTVAPKAKVATPKLPVDADIRVFANGRVYPSEAFAKEFALEFVKKAVDSLSGTTYVVGNGLDIFDSKRWGAIKGKLPQELIFISAVPKGVAKVDMWGSTSYDDKGEPKASVLTQGSNTFAKKQLVPMLADIYGINWETTVYVDLKVDREHTISSPTGIYHLPKLISGGKHKGEDTYIRREFIVVNPLTVEHKEEKEAKDAKQLDIFEDTSKAPSTDDMATFTEDKPEITPEATPEPEVEPVIADAIPEAKQEKNAEPEDTDKGDMDWAKGLGSL